MTAYDASAWTDLFVAAAGASAALAGLVFVAVSINVDRILALPGLPDRALQALAQLLGVVVFSLLVLTPGQATATLGVELVALATPLTVASIVLIRRSLALGEAQIQPAVKQFVVIVGTAPFAIAGVSLLAEWGGGIYWVLAGVVLALIGAVMNAWVLLVEILR